MEKKAKGLGMSYVAIDTMLKTVNDLPTIIHGFTPKVHIDLGGWMGLTNFTIAPMDVFKITLGLEFCYEVNTFTLPRHNQMHISDAGGSCFVPLFWVPQNGIHLSAMRIVKRFKIVNQPFLFPSLAASNTHWRQ